MKIFCSIIAVWILLLAGTEAGYAQFKQDSKRSLFSDVKAFEVGDAIMVLIIEETSANNAASTTESRATDLSAGANASANTSSLQLGAGINSNNGFKASGQNSRSESIRSKLSARVTEVEANGNLKIEGTRTTKINGETQTIVIQGVVRPVDVSPDNSIYSYSILDLTLIINGDGNITKIQEPGLITKFFRLLF